MGNQERKTGKVSRREFGKGVLSGLAGGALAALVGCRGQEEKETEERPTATLKVGVESTPTEAVLTVTATSTSTRTVPPTATASSTPTEMPSPTETATPTAAAIIVFTPTTRPEIGPLCDPQSFVIPQEGWTGQIELGGKQLKKLTRNDTLGFLQAPSKERAALFRFLDESGMGLFVIRPKPETFKALDIPPAGPDRMGDLAKNLRLLLTMSEQNFQKQTEGQLRIDGSQLQALERMLFRKQEQKNGQVEVRVLANPQEIRVAREMIDRCQNRWDDSPIVMVEGVDQDGSQLYLAFDGLCGNLFLALKIPVCPPCQPVCASTPPPEEDRDENGKKETVTATAVPPQPPINTPVSGGSK